MCKIEFQCLDGLMSIELICLGIAKTKFVIINDFATLSEQQNYDFFCLKIYII
jgi:hypothetical protein